jgi:hypothetical protein
MLMPDEIELRRDAVRRFTLATRGAAAADRVSLLTEADLHRAERQIAAEARNIKAPASPPPVAAAAAPQPPQQPDGRVSEEQYGRMNNAERLDYARRFPQPTNGAR